MSDWALRFGMPRDRPSHVVTSFPETDKSPRGALSLALAPSFAVASGRKISRTGQQDLDRIAGHVKDGMEK